MRVPSPRAGLAAATLDVEREPTGQVAADLGFLGLREQLADVVEDAGVGGRVGPRGSSDRALINMDHLVQVLQATDPSVQPGDDLERVDLAGQDCVEDVVDQGGLARAADPGHGHKTAEREVDRDISQVVLPRAVDDELALRVGRPPDHGNSDASTTRDIVGGERVNGSF